MTVNLIIGIIAAGVFAVLLTIYIVVYFRRRKEARELMAKLSEIYSPDAQFKQDYDFAFDEETSAILMAKLGDKPEEGESVKVPIAKISDGDEITGTYKPEDN